MEVNEINGNFIYNRKEMRYRTEKTRNNTPKWKDAKVTDANSANIFETKLQPTQRNAAFKMKNVHANVSYELHKIRYQEHLHESSYILIRHHWQKWVCIIRNPSRSKPPLRNRVNSLNTIVALIKITVSCLANQTTGFC